MSVNTQRDDLVESLSRTMPNNHSSAHSYGSIDPEVLDSHSSNGSRHWNPEDGKVSPARRTFLLFTTFDLILTFILWVIYTQLIGKTPIWKAFEDQVFNYDFKNSLFDTVMISTARFTFIMLAYALFRISHWWVIAVSTTMTCIYLLAKCFIFEFNDKLLGGQNPLSYIVLIVCFILAWIETWMLDFKVLPMEKRITNRSIPRSHTDREDTRLLDDDRSYSRSEATTEYYSPFHTPQGSDDEAEPQSRYNSVPSSRTHSRKASDASLYSVQSNADLENYTKLLEDAREAFLEMLSSDGWKVQSGKSLHEGIVSYQNIKKFGRKIFRLQGIMYLSPKELWADMIATLNDSPEWNPTILESRTLETIDDNTEVTYNIAAEAAGGLVSSRDFVSIRRKQCRVEGAYISFGVGCTHPDMPVHKKYVRGDNGPGGWAFDPVEGEPDQCIFTWIVNSNLKGWIPQAAIDQAMSGVLVTYFKLLLERYGPERHRANAM